MARIVEGSVRRVGSRLRITVQLVDAAEGYHVWSERFDRELGDVFALQDEIAARVVEALKVRLDPPSHPRPRPRDVQAYELYLKGRYFWNKRYHGELRKAVAAFEAAIARDPEFALAHAGLADACSVLGYYGLARETEVFAQARRAAERALALDPRVAGGPRVGRARARLVRLGPAGRGSRLRRALELAPDHVPAHLYLAHVLGVQDRGREGLASARAGLERDPLSPLAHTLVATASYLAGDDEEALRTLGRRAGARSRLSARARLRHPRREPARTPRGGGGGGATGREVLRRRRVLRVPGRVGARARRTDGRRA